MFIAFDKGFSAEQLDALICTHWLPRHLLYIVDNTIWITMGKIRSNIDGQWITEYITTIKDIRVQKLFV